MDISRELRYQRERRNLTQSELARKAHVSKSYLSQLESTPGKAVSVEILYRLAKVLRVGMGNFYEVTKYCQRCGVNFKPTDRHHCLSDDRYHITYIIGHACSKCAKEYSDIVQRHQKEISDWVNGRNKKEDQ